MVPPLSITIDHLEQSSSRSGFIAAAATFISLLLTINSRRRVIAPPPLGPRLQHTQCLALRHSASPVRKRQKEITRHPRKQRKNRRLCLGHICRVAHHRPQVANEVAVASEILSPPPPQTYCMWGPLRPLSGLGHGRHGPASEPQPWAATRCAK